MQRKGPAPFISVFLLLSCVSVSAELGKDWTELTPTTSWFGRHYAAVVSHEGKMFVLGGMYDDGTLLDDGWRNDVLSSDDGTSWTVLTPSAAWAARLKHTAVVYDGKIWVVGGTAGQREVWQSGDGASWTLAAASAPWAYRLSHASIVYDGKMWVMGGWCGGTGCFLNDVWYSVDGTSWTQATPSAPWTARESFGCVVFNDRMWIMGGRYWTTGDPGKFLNDVWYSTDGTSWTQATGAAPWSPRSSLASVVYDHKMWVLGGSYLNDVWYSSNGTSWTCATSSADWAGWASCRAVVHDGKMWVIDREVWCSSDGVNWTQTTYAYPWWSKRYGHTSVVFDDKVWVIGGRLAPDVWYSSDGENWTVANFIAPFSSRYDHSSVVHDGKMWVLGGRGSGVFNDVWYSADGRTWTSATLSASWAPRFSHASVSWDGKIWVMGGGDYDGPFYDTWCSTDGTSWTRWTMWVVGGYDPTVVPYEYGFVILWDGQTRFSSDGKTLIDAGKTAPQLNRTGHTAVYCDNRFWLMGGQNRLPYYPYSLYNFRDVWCYDPPEWRRVTEWADWTARSQHTSVAFNDRIWIFGGVHYFGPHDQEDMFNDIWYSELPYYAAARRWQRYR